MRIIADNIDISIYIPCRGQDPVAFRQPEGCRPVRGRNGTVGIVCRLPAAHFAADLDGCGWVGGDFDEIDIITFEHIFNETRRIGSLHHYRTDVAGADIDILAHYGRPLFRRPLTASYIDVSSAVGNSDGIARTIPVSTHADTAEARAAIAAAGSHIGSVSNGDSAEMSVYRM